MCFGKYILTLCMAHGACVLLFGQGVAEPCLGFILQQRLESDARTLVSKYDATLKVMSNSQIPLSRKEVDARAIATHLFDSERTMIYDDIYLYGQRDQFFPALDYLLTIPAWYPTGAVISIDLVSLDGWIWDTVASQIEARAMMIRYLSGYDFLKQYQIDTLSISASINFDVGSNSNGLQIGCAKISSIIPHYGPNSDPLVVALGDRNRDLTIDQAGKSQVVRPEEEMQADSSIVFRTVDSVDSVEEANLSKWDDSRYLGVGRERLLLFASQSIRERKSRKGASIGDDNSWTPWKSDCP